MTETGAMQVGPKQRFIVPPQLMKLVEKMDASEILRPYNEKSSNEVPVYELKEIIEKLSEKLSAVKEKIAKLEKGKIDTVFIIIGAAGSADLIVNSIELLAITEKPLITSSVCIESIIRWIQEIIDEKISKP